MIAQRRRNPGFTLVELMIVVVILSVLAVSLAPSVRRTVLEQRSGATAREVVRVAREARLRATTQRRAHLLQLEGSHVRVLRGSNNSCTMNDWAAIEALCSKSSPGVRAAGSECIELDLGAAPYSVSGSALVRLQEVTPGSDPGSEDAVAAHRVICFAPGGTVYHGTTLGDALLANNTVGGGFVFQLDMVRQETSETMVPARRVLVPLTGMAKVLQ